MVNLQPDQGPVGLSDLSAQLHDFLSTAQQQQNNNNNNHLSPVQQQQNVVAPNTTELLLKTDGFHKANNSPVDIKSPVSPSSVGPPTAFSAISAIPEGETRPASAAGLLATSATSSSSSLLQTVSASLIGLQTVSASPDSGHLSNNSALKSPIDIVDLAAQEIRKGGADSQGKVRMIIPFVE